MFNKRLPETTARNVLPIFPFGDCSSAPLPVSRAFAASPIRHFAVSPIPNVAPRTFQLPLATPRVPFISSAVVAPDEVKYSAGLCTDGSELPPLFRRVSWLF